jgi:hypothetical protein
VVALSFAACGDDKPGVTACEPGSERCSCYGNQTCNMGLECLSSLCVSPFSGSGAGGKMSGNGGPGADSGAGGSAADSGADDASAGAAGEPIVGSGGASGASNGSAGSGIAGRTGTGGSGGRAGSGGSGSGGRAGSSGQGANLIANGDFSQGDSNWLLTYHNTTGALLSTSNEYCIQPSDYALSITLGWPKSPTAGITLEPGASYSFSYSAKSIFALTITAKIGEVVTPYKAAVAADDIVDSSMPVFVHRFTAPSSLTAVGVAFDAKIGGDNFLCIYDVSLTKD